MSALALAVASCASATPTGVGVAGTGASAYRDDAALELARALPRGAERCVVARPLRLPLERRGLFVRISHSDPLVWSSALPVLAYVAATRHDLANRSASVALVRFAVPRDVVREKLGARGSGVRVRWVGDPRREPPCRGDECSVARARFVDSRTVRLESGVWPSEPGPAVEQRCRVLALGAPDAVEIEARLGEEIVLGMNDDMPRREETVIHATARRVAIERTAVMPSIAAARARAASEASRAVGGLDAVFGGMPPGDVTRRRVRHRLITELRYEWQDLELAIGDDRRLREALAHTATLTRPLPVDQVDTFDPAALRQQIQLRSEALERATGTARHDLAMELRRLLERAITADPDDVDTVRGLVELLLGELSDPRAAVALTDRIIAAGAADRIAWRLLRRQALAAVGTSELAAALASDAVVPQADAARVAAEIVALRARGLDYEWAEGASVAAEALARRTGRQSRLVEVRDASVPVRSIVETLVAMGSLALEGRDELLRGAYVLARGTIRPRPAPARMRGAPSPPPDADLLPMHVHGSLVLFGATTLVIGPGQRALGEAMLDGVERGALELSFAVVPAGSTVEHAELVAKIAGRIDGESFVIERASGGASRVDWSRVERYLARPLASIEPRTFPAPEAQIDANDSAAAERLLTMSRDIAGARCMRQGPRLHCTAAPDDPGAVRRVVYRIARAELAADARALVTP